MDTRMQTELQSEVDLAIIAAHSGFYTEACEQLLRLGFSQAEVFRILNDPDNRRSYINDYLTGF